MPEVYEFDEVPSTMDALRELLDRKNLPDWTSVLAKTQTEGRGQARKRWISQPGNIFASVRLPAAAPFSQMGGAVAFGALVVHALRAAGYPVFLKWMNDAVIRGDGGYLKIAGILLEERNGLAIAGVGINLLHAPVETGQDEGDALPAGCLAQTGLQVTAPGVLWRELIGAIQRFYEYAGDYAQSWPLLANEWLAWKGQDVVWTDGGNSLRGALAGVACNGAMILDCGGKWLEKTSGSVRAPFQPGEHGQR